MFFDRSGGQGPVVAKQVSRSKILRGPSRGWIRSSDPGFPTDGGAYVLRNFYPTREGGKLRGGSSKHGTIGSNAVASLLPYEAASGKLFAADANNIYDITSPADPDVAPSADVTGLTNGDWVSTQFTTAGGSFLVIANGADSVRNYDGTSWTTPSITGVTSADLDYVWSFKSRLFFIESGTMSAWYLPVESIAGAATELPLGAEFSNGGALLFGATWSRDSGSGLDDFCIFVTTKGEVAVYQGTDPSSSTTWAKVGVYEIGRPLDKLGHFRGGGDVAVLTDEGIVPLSVAVTVDRGALPQSAVTVPIEEAWQEYVSARVGLQRFSVALWRSESMLVVGLPKLPGVDAKCFVANSRTGAWGEYIGWDIRSMTVFDDRLFFGTADGKVIEGNVGGSDEGAAYNGVYLPLFDSFGSADEKAAVHARAALRTDYPYSVKMFANADFDVEIPVPLDPDVFGPLPVWDSGIWDQSVWASGEEIRMVKLEWQTVHANGYALAPGLIIASNDTLKPDVEVVSVHLQYEDGQVMG